MAFQSELRSAPDSGVRRRVQLFDLFDTVLVLGQHGTAALTVALMVAYNGASLVSVIGALLVGLTIQLLFALSRVGLRYASENWRDEAERRGIFE